MPIVKCLLDCEIDVPDELANDALKLHMRTVHPPEPDHVHDWQNVSPITKRCRICDKTWWRFNE